MNKNVLLGLGAIALVALGFLLSDYMRLRGEVAASEEPTIAEATPTVQADPTETPTEAPLAEPEPEPTPEPQPAALTFNSGFANYPASRYTGAAKPLDLSPDQRTFRTRLGDAYGRPVNFGGSLTMTVIGCGTGCVTYYALDKSSGKVLSFPLGGEGNMYLQLSHRPDSALVWARWGGGTGGGDCMAQPWVLGAGGFTAQSAARPIQCD